MEANGTIYTKIEGNIASIEFGHSASNSFTSHMLERLTKQINAVSDNKDISVLILKSEGSKTFCAGAAFGELVAISNPQEGQLFFSGFANVINAMRTCKKLIIGRVQGKLVGGGVGLASACDYVFATESASLKLSELTIGIGPFVIAPAVIRKIGLGPFTDLSLDASHWKTAYWGKEKNLFTRVFESIEELDKSLEDFTFNLSKYNPEALDAMKKILWEGTDHWNVLLTDRAKMSGNLALSKFTKDTLAKF